MVDQNKIDLALEKLREKKYRYAHPLIDVSTYVDINWDRGCMSYGSDFDDMTDACERAIEKGLVNEYEQLSDEELQDLYDKHCRGK